MKKIPLSVSTISALILQSAAFTAQAFPGVMQLNGDAALQGGALVRLTPELKSQAGSAFVPISLGVDGAFHTNFSFRMSDGGDCSGELNGTDDDGLGSDGIVFVIQNILATALGDPGDGIGYDNIGTESLGVEFDSWDNRESHNDPNGNHIGIDTLGNIASDATAVFEPRFNDGGITYAWIDYDGTTLEVRVNTSNTRPCGAILAQSVDLDSILGGTTGWVGFTSGTGGACGNHDILSWNFAVPVKIDIKPDKFPNKINLGSGGDVRVAIFGSDSLNVNNIDQSSCTLVEAGVKTVGNTDNLKCSTENVNDDAYEDLVCHFVTADLNALDSTSTDATAMCDLADGTPIKGVDSVYIAKE